MKLREWQEKAFPLWWAKKRGIIKVVTGGGKTFFAIHCLKQYLEDDPQKSILIVVPSIALLDQWYESLSQEFKPKDISLNGGGEQTNELKKICITTIDSLKNIIEEHSKETNSKLSNEIIKNFDKEILNFVQVCPKEMLDKLKHPITTKSTIKKVS